MAQLIIGGFLAVILLGLYMWSIYDAVVISLCTAGTNCREYSDNMAFLLNSIGGLISATVVGVLGATSSGEFPSIKSLDSNPSSLNRYLSAIMPSVYIFFWVICGLITVLYAFGPTVPNVVPALEAQAKGWLGAAIAAVYAYFGISPNGKSRSKPEIKSVEISPKNITLSAAAPTRQITVSGTDADNNPLTNLKNDDFQWLSDDPTIAEVDQNGVVKRMAAGTCKIKATAKNSSVVSNDCSVICQ